MEFWSSGVLCGDEGTTGGSELYLLEENDSPGFRILCEILNYRRSPGYKRPGFFVFKWTAVKSVI